MPIPAEDIIEYLELNDETHEWYLNIENPTELQLQHLKEFKKANYQHTQ